MEKRLALCVTLFLAACQTPSTSHDQRGLWRADPGLPASCAGSCGGRSPDRCYCDAACAGWGDCCPDYAPVCSAGDDGGASTSDGGASTSDGGTSTSDGGTSTSDGGISTACGVCPASSPVCGDDGVCHKCTAHSQCASGICRLEPIAGDAVGTCATADEISLVDNRSEPTGDCKVDHPTRDGKTPATAYCTIQEGVDANPLYVLVAGHGAAAPYSAFTANKAKVVVGAAMPTVFEAGKSAYTQPSGGMVTLDGLALVGTATFPAVLINAFYDTAYLTIRRSTMSGGKYGLEVATYPAYVTVTGSTIADNVGAGVSASVGSVTLDGNLIVRNGGAGVELSTCDYSMINNMIAFNSGRGVGFTYASAAGYGFSFNTVVDNGSGTLAGGIDCGGSQQLIDSSIVVRNSTAGTTQFTGSCVFNNVAAGTDSAPGIVPGVAPVFVSETKAGMDLHLVASSTNNAASCIDRAVDAAGDMSPSLTRPDHDFDGAPRPQGAARDIGADEAR